MALIPFGILSASVGAAIGRIGIAGYTGGGNMVGGSQSDVVDKIAFSNDTRSTLGTGLSLGKYYPAGFANSAVAGYVAGGGALAIVRATVDKFAFPADTRTTLGTGLSAARGGCMGFANSGVAGYVAGGDNGSVFVTTVDKFAFPGDTRSTLGTGLSGNRGFAASAENTLVAGYHAGGDSSSGSPNSNVDKFTYPADTRSALASGLVAGAWYSSVGLSNNAVAIYFQDNASTTMTKYAMPTDTRSSFASGSAARNAGSSISNSGLAGYIAGGQIGSTLDNVIEKISFINDSRSTIAATCSVVSNGRTMGMSNQGVF
jgi:hypothetical protein